MTDPELTVLTGFVAGLRVSVPPQGLTMGRSEDAGLRFDPHQDLHVSGLHAAILPAEGEGWLLEDLESLNGTFLNGRPLTGPARLEDGDEIQLGEGGPTLQFRAPGGSPGEEGGTTHARKGSRTHLLVGVLSMVLLATILVAAFAMLEGRRYRQQVEAMQLRIDSILDASAETAGTFQGRIQGLHEALLKARADLESVRADLDAAQTAGDSEEIQALRVQLQEAQTALVRHQLAANLDYDAIEARNRRAVAKVFVDFGDEVVSATAFAVRPDGTLMTNRHVVAGASGIRTPVRIAVQFADSRQVWPARVLATSRTVDLALLKVDNIVGDVPTVAGFNARPGAVQAGAGVGVIGFPLGGADPGDDAARPLARTTLTAGIVQGVTPGLLEVNGYGVEGSSGSPVFDGEGEVVGVLFGGRVENGERTLFAVPAARALAFLRAAG